MNEVIDRVAHAICEEDLGGPMAPMSEQTARAAERYRAIARAAIIAMRFPAYPMIEAAREQNGRNLDAWAVWQAMIDVALKE